MKIYDKLSVYFFSIQVKKHILFVSKKLN